MNAQPIEMRFQLVGDGANSGVTEYLLYRSALLERRSMLLETASILGWQGIRDI
ncbi:MAG: hypothetical protein J0L58_02660 [Burkholderiales bacterium]|nr:hypothetical protein [Burkholderiales bacterium]